MSKQLVSTSRKDPGSISIRKLSFFKPISETFLMGKQWRWSQAGGEGCSSVGVQISVLNGQAQDSGLPDKCQTIGKDLCPCEASDLGSVHDLVRKLETK